MKDAPPVSIPQCQQTFLTLTQTKEFISHFTSVDFPDLETAKIDRDKLKRKHGKDNFAAQIRKCKNGTYAMVYTLREIRTVNLY